MTDDRPIPPGLAPFWSGTVGNFATLASDPIQDEMKERHRMYSLLLMSLIVAKWNGNKYGEIGDYGNWRANQQIGEISSSEKIYVGGTYLGHNIAALAVDAEGRIMDFDFNHNDIFDSTVEHAESRLVRRLFALDQIYEPFESMDQNAKIISRRRLRPRQSRHLYATAITENSTNDAVSIPPPVAYSTLLKDVTIYTSLESCAQCSGIMCLGSVKEIVYLQWDQGQFLIGNIMWQATTAQQAGFIAPRPIRGDEFDFEYFTYLNEANVQFSSEVGPDNPFYKSPNPNESPIIQPSVTSFLCTDIALQIYQKAQAELNQWTVSNYPTYQPTPSALTNQEALDEIHDYLVWVSEINNRGTPHRV